MAPKKKAAKKTARTGSSAHDGPVIPFTFDFSASGGFDAWEVWSNGVERAHGAHKGSFSGVIRPGFPLHVIFKVWGGDYAITYSCAGPPGTARTGVPASPINGSTAGNASDLITIDIQF